MERSEEEHKEDEKERDLKSHNWMTSVVSGTAAGAMSAVLFHPISVLQTRFQVTPKKGVSITGYQYVSWRHAVTSITRNEGFGALYQGLSPSLLGNATSWGIYFVIYNGAKKEWAKRFSESGDLESVQKLGPLATICCATIAGWTTSICTNPIWVIKTRMQIQLYNSADNYTSISHAFRTVWKEEGIKGLYRGLLPSFFGVSHGVVQFAVYEELNKLVREYYQENSIGFSTSVCTGAISKICATVSTYPYQVVKARLQMRPKPGQPPPYVGVFNTINRIWKVEGAMGFYRGCGLNLLRVTPSSALTLGTYELVSNIMRTK